MELGLPRHLAWGETRYALLRPCRALEAVGVAKQALSRESMELVRDGLGRETRRGTAQSGPDPVNGWVLGALEPESLQALGAPRDHSPASYLNEIASRTR